MFILGFGCLEGVLLILLGALFLYLATLKIRGAAGFYFKIISTLLSCFNGVFAMHLRVYNHAVLCVLHWVGFTGVAGGEKVHVYTFER